MENLARLAVAAAVAFLWAVPFRLAAGIEGNDGPLTGLCGLLIGAVTYFVLFFGEVQIRLLLAWLSRTRYRPTQAVIITLIVTGALCLIGALCLQFFGPSATLVGEVNARPGMVQAHFGGRGSFLVPITTVVVLLAGLVLIGVGIWGSIPAEANSGAIRETGIRAD